MSRGVLVARPGAHEMVGPVRRITAIGDELALRHIIVHCASTDLSVVEKFPLSGLLPLPFAPSGTGLVQDD